MLGPVLEDATRMMRERGLKIYTPQLNTFFNRGISKALQDPRDWKTPGVCKGLGMKPVV